MATYRQRYSRTAWRACACETSSCAPWPASCSGECCLLVRWLPCWCTIPSIHCPVLPIAVSALSLSLCDGAKGARSGQRWPLIRTPRYREVAEIEDYVASHWKNDGQIPDAQLKLAETHPRHDRRGRREPLHQGFIRREPFILRVRLVQSDYHTVHDVIFYICIILPSCVSYLYVLFCVTAVTHKNRWSCNA